MHPELFFSLADGRRATPKRRSVPASQPPLLPMFSWRSDYDEGDRESRFSDKYFGPERSRQMGEFFERRSFLQSRTAWRNRAFDHGCRPGSGNINPIPPADAEIFLPVPSKRRAIQLRDEIRLVLGLGLGIIPPRSISRRQCRRTCSLEIGAPSNPNVLPLKSKICATDLPKSGLRQPRYLSI